MDTVDRITEYIRTQLASGEPWVSADSNLAGDGHLDSTAMLELILWVGDTFGIAIQAEDFSPENFGTPRNIAEFIHSRKSMAADSTSVAGIA